MRSSIFLIALLLAVLISLVSGAAVDKKKKKHTTTTKKHTTTTKKHTTTTTKKHTTTTVKHATTTTVAPTTTATHVVTTAHPTTTTTKTTTHTTTASPLPSVKPGKAGQTGAIWDANDFCIFLPPSYGGDISANEDKAVAFCTKDNVYGATKARVLPAGFIQSAHFVSNPSKGYVQVTGRMDRSKYGLSSKDGGGQYDMRAPVGATCAGYASFVQLTEPDAQIYCIRCCKNKSDCPVNRSTYGCKSVLGGDYS